MSKFTSPDGSPTEGLPGYDVEGNKFTMSCTASSGGLDYKDSDTHQLSEYIEHNYDGNQNAFATENGISRQLVNTWVKKNFIVVGDTIYSPRQKLKPTK